MNGYVWIGSDPMYYFYTEYIQWFEEEDYNYDYEF